MLILQIPSITNVHCSERGVYFIRERKNEYFLINYYEKQTNVAKKIIIRFEKFKILILTIMSNCQLQQDVVKEEYSRFLNFIVVNAGPY